MSCTRPHGAHCACVLLFEEPCCHCGAETFAGRREATSSLTPADAGSVGPSSTSTTSPGPQAPGS